nr:heat shock protein beta-1 isoform X2 [Nothobranchius furzeri]
MTEPARTEKPCEEHNTAPTQGKWWQFSQILNPDVGLPRVLEPGERRWMEVDWFRRNLAAFSWLGSIPAPLSGPYVSESMLHPGQKISKWRVSMDVAHFHPSEISLSLRDGFLEVAGTHEERPDEHGFIARCFTRKYRLPAEVDATKLTSRLSVDGILTIEAPVPEFSAPVAIILPIKVETEEPEELDMKTDDNAEVSQSEDQPCRSTAAPEPEDEETQEKPAGDAHPPVAGEDKRLDSLQQSSEHHEAVGERRAPSSQLEHGEVQVKEDGGEELSQPEEQELGNRSDIQSQELEAADMKQEPTE